MKYHLPIRFMPYDSLADVESKQLQFKYIPIYIYHLLLMMAEYPTKLIEEAIYSNKINKSTLTNPPIFILGYWRSGTTHLHNLLSKDELLCYPTNFQVQHPTNFMLLTPLFNKKKKEMERGFDSVLIGRDSPQEEEFAMAKLMHHSYYNYAFSDDSEGNIKTKLLLDNMKPNQRDELATIYYSFLKKISYYNRGKTILSKNPPNICRISLLLQLFPDAKFISIYRNPYHVYNSMLNLVNYNIKHYEEKPLPKGRLSNNIIRNYQEIMTQYINDKKLIPNKQLIEITYEDLIANPDRVLENIYTHHNLPNLKETLINVDKYLLTIKSYQKNRYPDISAAILSNINSHWSDIITKLGYPLRKY